MVQAGGVATLPSCFYDFRIIEAWRNVLSGNYYRSNPSAKRIAELDEKLRHDVFAAVTHVKEFTIPEELPLVHFGCTSEDVVNVKYRMIADHYFPGRVWDIKWGGATGNFHAFVVNNIPIEQVCQWVQLMLNELGIKGRHLMYTTQVNPNDDLLDLLMEVRNHIRGQLVYPICLELINELGLSRWQRDLSNSTRMRNLEWVLAIAKSTMEEKI